MALCRDRTLGQTGNSCVMTGNFPITTELSHGRSSCRDREFLSPQDLAKGRISPCHDIVRYVAMVQRTECARARRARQRTRLGSTIPIERAQAQAQRDTSIS